MPLIRSQNSKFSSNFYLRDYTHASKTFLSEPGYEMAPKYGWLFHVRFEFNSVGQSQNGETSKTISVLCKAADLPKFNIEYEELNKYNKKEILPKKLKYEPVNLTFHDDAKNTIRDMWLAYNNYYFADAGVTPQAWAFDDTYAENRTFNRYGLDNNQTEKFIKSVDIYSMGNHKYTKYSLINPLIVSFDFDRYDYSDGSKVMEAQIRLDYETVLYYEGSTESIPGFGTDNKPYYDNQFSTLNPTSFTMPPATVIDNIESSLTKPTNPTFEQPYQNDIRTSPVPVSLQEQERIRVVAASSATNNRQFNFPTAQAIDDASANVDLNGRNRFNQGKIPNGGRVTSNGINVNSTPPSSNGGWNTTATDNRSSLIINPIIPDGLTPAERDKFTASYPPLPTSDARTRLPPYV